MEERDKKMRRKRGKVWGRKSTQTSELLRGRALYTLKRALHTTKRAVITFIRALYTL